MRRKRLNQALSMVLAFSMAFGMAAAPVTASASEEMETEFLSEPAETNGIYQIGTSDELRWFGEHVNSGNADANAVLLADIDLSGAEWVPIGSPDDPYTGVFDGGNFEILNLSYILQRNGVVYSANPRGR